MRSVRRAIWTSDEPVSVSWSRCSAMVADLSGMRCSGSLGRATGKTTLANACGYRAGVAEDLRVTPSLRIPLSELDWQFSASGGPGGQHANTSNTRVELRFDVAASPSLGPRQRARLLDQLGPVVRVVASGERSQARNRELALDRLRRRLSDALRVPEQRRPTTPTLGSRERRLSAKRRRGQAKRNRAQVADEE